MNPDAVISAPIRISQSAEEDLPRGSPDNPPLYVRYQRDPLTAWPAE